MSKIRGRFSDHVAAHIISFGADRRFEQKMPSLEAMVDQLQNIDRSSTLQTARQAIAGVVACGKEALDFQTNSSFRFRTIHTIKLAEFSERIQRTKVQLRKYFGNLLLEFIADPVDGLCTYLSSGSFESTPNTEMDSTAAWSLKPLAAVDELRRVCSEQEARDFDGAVEVRRELFQRIQNYAAACTKQAEDGSVGPPADNEEVFKQLFIQIEVAATKFQTLFDTEIGEEEFKPSRDRLTRLYAACTQFVRDSAQKQLLKLEPSSSFCMVYSLVATADTQDSVKPQPWACNTVLATLEKTDVVARLQGTFDFLVEILATNVGRQNLLGGSEQGDLRVVEHDATTHRIHSKDLTQFCITIGLVVAGSLAIHALGNITKSLHCFTHAQMSVGCEQAKKQITRLDGTSPLVAEQFWFWGDSLSTLVLG